MRKEVLPYAGQSLYTVSSGSIIQQIQYNSWKGFDAMDSPKQGKLVGGLVASILGWIGIVYSIITMTSNDYVKWYGFGAFGEWAKTPEGITTIVILIVSIIGFITGGVLLLSLKSSPTHSNQRNAKQRMTSERIHWLTRTALLIALLITWQWASRLLGGNQFVTGSGVNFFLFTAALLVGFSGGLSVAVLSPFLAFFAGVGPVFFPLTPIIAAGNAALVIIVWLLADNKKTVPTWRLGGAVAVAAVAKFLVLWIGVTWVAPLFMEVRPAILAMFTWPQLVTASIGGALAIAAAPLLRRAIKL
jgi:magnesium-transporting ATPase (P-type)